MRTIRPEMTQIQKTLPKDFYQKLFTLYFNHQQKDFYINGSQDSKELMTVIFEEDKKNQFLSINYVNTRKTYDFSEVVVQLKDDNTLYMSDKFSETDTVIKAFMNVLQASYEDDKTYRFENGEFVEMVVKHRFNNALDKSKIVRKIK